VVVKDSSSNILQETVFTYDVNDRRIGKWVDPDGPGSQPAVQMWTVYDGVNPYADFDGTGSLTTRYLADPHQPDVLFARVAANGTTAWYLRDNINSVRQVVSPTGAVLNAITYDSFGNILSETNPANGDRFKYTCREYDAELGIYYYRARYYDPATGRFLGEDPKGFAAGDANLYRYVANRPTILTDPSGMDWSDTVVGWMPDSWVNAIAARPGDGFSQVSNYFAGWGDTLSFGLTSYARRGLGWDAVDYNSGAYRYGEYTGIAHGFLMMGTNGYVNVTRQMGGARGGLGTGLGRYYWDGRQWNSVARTWSGQPPILRDRGLALHHVIFPQRWARSRGGWIPDGIVNAGFNYIPMSSWRNSVLLNRYAWLGRPYEWAYRIGYVSQFSGVYFGVTSYVVQPLFK
jgi:RHS repeat-associated protein